MVGYGDDPKSTGYLWPTLPTYGKDIGHSDYFFLGGYLKTGESPASACSLEYRLGRGPPGMVATAAWNYSDPTAGEE